MRPMLAVVLVLALISGLTDAQARIIGEDDRQSLAADFCHENTVTLARLLVTGSHGKTGLSTATAIETGDGGIFFLSTAHSLFLNGKLRAPLAQISVELLLRDPLGGCRYVTTSISRLAVGSTKPRQTFSGAARDLLVFAIEAEAEVLDKIRPLRFDPRRQCRSRDVELIGFAWDIAVGLEPFRTSCKLRRRPSESEYPETAFQHHDCDTSTGVSGSLLLCTQGRSIPVPYAVHAVGWGTDGQNFGQGVYNVAIPIDPQTLRTLIRSMRNYGD